MVEAESEYFLGKWTKSWLKKGIEGSIDGNVKLRIQSLSYEMLEQHCDPFLILIHIYIEIKVIVNRWDLNAIFLGHFPLYYSNSQVSFRQVSFKCRVVLTVQQSIIVLPLLLHVKGWNEGMIGKMPPTGEQQIVLFQYIIELWGGAEGWIIHIVKGTREIRFSAEKQKQISIN